VGPRIDLPSLDISHRFLAVTLSIETDLQKNWGNLPPEFKNVWDISIFQFRISKILSQSQVIFESAKFFYRAGFASFACCHQPACVASTPSFSRVRTIPISISAKFSILPPPRLAMGNPCTSGAIHPSSSSAATKTHRKNAISLS
jgi:hypothetical protein